MIDDYLLRGYWDMVSIADILEQNAQNCPDKEAIVDSESRLTWLQLNRLVDRIALGLLELDIKRDQAIVAQIPNSTTPGSPALWVGSFTTLDMVPLNVHLFVKK
jgi:non-ribosomal peptide synthetase component E (peptide arylation enzyme)